MQKGFLSVVFLILFSKGLGDELRIKWGYKEVEKVVTFHLYTRQNLHKGVLLPLGDKAILKTSGFKGVLPTIICAHGYFNHANASWIHRIKEEILKEQEVNFITLDYSKVSFNVLYPEVVNFTKYAGLHTGKFLKFLQAEGKLSLDKVHLMGHSLGGQLIGLVWRAFPTKKVLGRVTALDPAGPLFENAPESERINPNSAKIVDVIHTCRVFVGMKKPVGTIDFYPNGGYNQRGCSDFDLKCQHERAHTYFYETIKNSNRNIYKAKKCENLEKAINGSCFGESATMGYHLNYRSPGIYYIKIK